MYEMKARGREDGEGGGKEPYQPETLHVIPQFGRNMEDICHAREPRVAFQFRVVDKRPEHLPAPLTVLVVASDPPHVEKGLDRLRPLEIMGVLVLNHIVVFPLRGRVYCYRIRRRGGGTIGFRSRRVVRFEKGDFRGQARSRGFVHAPTRLCQFNGKIQVGLFFLAPFAGLLGFCHSFTASGCQSDGAWHEAHKMVHFRLQVARQTVGSFREDGEVGFLGIGD